MEKAMKRYGVVHRFSIAYHLQTNGQVENTNRAIKRILEKATGKNKKDWLYLMRRSLEVLRKFHWMILGGRFNQLSHVSSPLLSKPGEY
ncbi:MAK10-like protein [Tanacetum coccineum]